MSTAPRCRMRALFVMLPLLLPVSARAQAPGASPPSSQAPGASTPTTQAPGAADAPPPTAPAPGPAPAPTVAPAQAPALTDVDVDASPAPCRTLAKEAHARALVRALGARLSLASCLADAAMAELSLIDGEESVLALAAALAPSRALLDEVIAHAAPENQLLAQRGIALLYAGAASRMLSTVPAPVDGSDASQALRDIRLANVEAMIAPWRETEATAHAAIVKLAAAYPRLARDRAYASAIHTSRAHAGKPVVTRP